MLTLEKLVLYGGDHFGDPPPGEPGCKLCFWEAYNAITDPTGPSVNGPYADVPEGVSDVLYDLVMWLNDTMPPTRRQALKRYLPTDGRLSPLAGTADKTLDAVRYALAADWLLRVVGPTWLDAAGLTRHADKLRGLPQITDADDADDPARLAPLWKIMDKLRDRTDDYTLQVRDDQHRTSEVWSLYSTEAEYAAVAVSPPHVDWILNSRKLIWYALVEVLRASGLARAEEVARDTVFALQDKVFDLLDSMIRVGVSL